jgi:hypothetical protein
MGEGGRGRILTVKEEKDAHGVMMDVGTIPCSKEVQFHGSGLRTLTKPFGDKIQLNGFRCSLIVSILKDRNAKPCGR